jgi:hypothetical protein
MGIPIVTAAPAAKVTPVNGDWKGEAGNVADVVLMAALTLPIIVDPAAVNIILPHTSQSPADKLIDVQLAGVALVKETAVPVAVTYSPTLPVFALLLVVVPTMPLVCEGVKLPVAVRADVVTVPVKVGEARGA